LLAYLASFAQLHWLAVTLYLNPAYSFYNLAVVEAGFRQSLYAIGAIMLGSVLIAPPVMKFLARRAATPRNDFPSWLAAALYIGIGAVSFVLLQLTRFGHVPSLTAVLACGAQFTVAGLCLCCYTAVRKKQYALVALSLASGMALPYVTLLAQGFMSFGVAAATVVFAFAASLVRSRFMLVACGLALAYFALSVYVGYMRDRPNLRSVIWSDASIQDRLDILEQSLSRFEWFDPNNKTHCERVDVRLNQNLLVGAAVTRLDGADYYAHGATIRDGMLATIPRAVWPDKPMTSGSGTLVSDYTGIRFAEGTSIGIGQLLELFINYGTPGVIVGFLLIGALVTVCDWRAGAALVQGNYPSFAAWLLIGMCLLNIIGSFVETFSAGAATVIVTTFLNKVVLGGAR
jgi:hypothetical protein